jgi:hypothetical protein
VHGEHADIDKQTQSAGSRSSMSSRMSTAPRSAATTRELHLAYHARNAAKRQARYQHRTAG